jgi:hypothetical protein
MLGAVGVVIGIDEDAFEAEHQVVRDPFQHVDAVVAHGTDNGRAASGLYAIHQYVIECHGRRPFLHFRPQADEVVVATDGTAIDVVMIARGKVLITPEVARRRDTGGEDAIAAAQSRQDRSLAESEVNQRPHFVTRQIVQVKSAEHLTKPGVVVSRNGTFRFTKIHISIPAAVRRDIPDCESCVKR